MRIPGLIIIFLIIPAISETITFRTEEEQGRFLEALKKREYDLFQEEMKRESERRGQRFTGVALDHPTPGSNDYSNMLPEELRPPSQKHHRPEALTATEADVVNEFGENDNWCFACVTPITKMKPELRRSIRNLLEMRRTTYPINLVSDDCLSARNTSKLKKQKCSFKYCQTLSVVDREAARSFVIRGCAEHFGAVNVEEFEKKSDYSCEMLHEGLEVKECICKTAKYCNAGWNKRSASSSGAPTIIMIIFLLPCLIFF
ncbi:unnamed protein product [Caenorhabditis bovis]|uniref:DUF19 domain-containing protein n=1 Tax=Caenorhabditis bovis TaxID=2654633 RepID=A0A8S1EBZ8_9PELO|nr:unnamed protein product [Caenorhabditis bovis]